MAHNTRAEKFYSRTEIFTGATAYIKLRRRTSESSKKHTRTCASNITPWKISLTHRPPSRLHRILCRILPHFPRVDQRAVSKDRRPSSSVIITIRRSQHGPKRAQHKSNIRTNLRSVICNQVSMNTARPSISVTIAYPIKILLLLIEPAHPRVRISILLPSVSAHPAAHITIQLRSRSSNHA